MTADILEFDEASHTYRVGGRVLPSVTQILRPIGPDLASIPPAVLERKRMLGTAAHLACELDDCGELDDSATDPDVMGYVRAWRLFVEQLEVTVLLTEHRAHSISLGYAGTIDRLAIMPTPEAPGGRAPWVLDLKTAAEPHPSYGVQLAGYDLLLRDAGKVAAPLRRGTVHLRPDGTYRLVPFNNPNDEPAFRALLAIHNWKESTQ